MKRSSATKKAKNKYLAFEIISILITILPLAFFMGFGFVTGDTKEKLVMSLTAIVGLTLTALNVMLKWHIRCALWILLFGVIYALRENAQMVLTIIGVIGGVTAVDEFVISPLAKKYKNQFTINKEIDKRL